MGTIAKQIERKSVGAKHPETIKDYIKTYETEVARALPKVMTPERFTRMAMTAITQTPKLQRCTPQSFIGAMLTAAQLGLEPNTPLGQAYLIPYGTVCQFQLGYRGLMDLAHRSGEIKNIEAHVVYENDEFDFEYGLNSNLRHIPAKKDKGEPIWVYAIFRLKNGGYSFEVASYDDCIAHGRKYSKSFSNGPWTTEPEEMAKKTVLKRVLKYAPLKSDFIVKDETVNEFNPNANTEDEAITVIPEDEPIEADYTEVDDDTFVDEKTGEVINIQGAKHHE